MKNFIKKRREERKAHFRNQSLFNNVSHQVLSPYYIMLRDVDDRFNQLLTRRSLNQ